MREEPAGETGRTWPGRPARKFDAALYTSAADRVMAGRFNLFASRELNPGFPPAWNRDPKSGTEAPLAFGKTLNYRDEALVGDIKYLWELNRHLELVTLAQAYHLGHALRGRGAGIPGILVPAVSLPERAELDQLPGAGNPAGQLVLRLAAPGRSTFFPVRGKQR